MKNFISKIVKATMLSGVLLIGVPSFSQSVTDTLKEKVDELKDRLNGMDERVLTNESDLSKLNKIKISGYIQAQYDYFENRLSYPSNSFQVRRTRVKFQYEPADGIKFVVQPELGPGGFELKDAYAVANAPWLKNIELWMGKFNRPNYEVEYSSSSREVPERSRIIKALYPGERAIGAKLEYSPKLIPLKVQVALLNGNDGLTFKDASGNNMNTAQNVTNKDYDNFKDLMGRITYSLNLGAGIGLDFGVNGYFGQLKATSTTTIKGDYTLDKSDVKVGDALKRNWLGAEFQLYADVLGGMSIKGEYMFGQNALPGYITSTSTTTSSTSLNATADTLTISNITTKDNSQKPNQINKFSGGYIYLVKNIGKKNQFALRYDFYDPNTQISKNDIGVKKYETALDDKKVNLTTVYSASDAQTIKVVSGDITNATKIKAASGVSDIAYNTLTLAWNYYLNDNIRFTLAYEMPMNEKTNAVDSKGNYLVYDKGTVNGVTKYNYYNDVFSQNTFTLRVQAKF